MSESLTITRVFDAPRELVFACWTEPDQLAAWLGPHGFTASAVTIKAEPGGAWRACLHSPDGDPHWMHGVYRDVSPPERLEFSFAWDTEGDLRDETRIRITFADLDGKTEMTFTHDGLPTTETRDDHHGGWTETFEDLAQYLHTVRKCRLIPTTHPQRRRSAPQKGFVMSTATLPRIVTAEEWQTEREALLAKEKELMKAADRLAAERRRLPMVPFPKAYEFEAPEGKRSLLDLFDGRRQLIVYHFMLHPGDEAGCPGCSMLVDNLPHLAHLNARDVTLKVVAPATLPEIEQYRTRMGWDDVPFVSCHGTDFADDCGVGTGFGVSVFLRDGDSVYRTYFTSGRGGETFMASHRYLDITPFGRQEAWEEESRGDDGPGAWWRRHDEY